MCRWLNDLCSKPRNPLYHSLFECSNIKIIVAYHRIVATAYYFKFYSKLTIAAIENELKVWLALTRRSVANRWWLLPFLRLLWQSQLVRVTCHHCLQVSNAAIYVYLALKLVQAKILLMKFHRIIILQVTSWP